MARQSSSRLSTMAARYLRMVEDGGFPAWIRNRTDEELDVFAEHVASLCGSVVSNDETKGQGISTSRPDASPPGRRA